MTTVATNLVSCSAVIVNVSFVVLSYGRMFWLTVEADVFCLLTKCCLNACFLYFGHPCKFPRLLVFSSSTSQERIRIITEFLT